MSLPWPERVQRASMPTDVLFHATTPKKLARYEATGTILPPIRGFDTEDAAREWGRTAGRTVILRVFPSGPVWPLPDHHQKSGLAWWALFIDGYVVIGEPK